MCNRHHIGFGPSIFSVATFREHSNLGSPERADAICRMGTLSMHTAAGAAIGHLAIAAAQKIAITGLDNTAMSVWTGLRKKMNGGDNFVCLKQRNGRSDGGYGAQEGRNILFPTYFKWMVSRGILRNWLSTTGISAKQAAMQRRRAFRGVASGDKVPADAS